MLAWNGRPSQTCRIARVAGGLSLAHAPVHPADWLPDLLPDLTKSSPGGLRCAAVIGLWELLKADWHCKTGRPEKADPVQLAKIEAAQQQRTELQADRLERQAAKTERRATKMSTKVGRGNIRANRAAQTAENLRYAADRKRSEGR
jgi:hypothetical protein